jgi:hypothetical protein
MTTLVVLVTLNLTLTLAVLAVLGGVLRNARCAAGASVQPAGASTATPASVASDSIHGFFADGPADAFRPDPTARFNVFRVDEFGRLALGDVQRYSGNDPEHAAQSKQMYQATHWRGRVFVFEHNQQLEVLE